MRTTSCA